MLTNELIKLRAVEPKDVDYLFQSENLTDLWQVSNTLVPFSKRTLSDYANSVHDLNAQGQFRFIIESIDSSLPIGMLDLFEFDAINSRAGIGIVITDVNSRNKGFADAALKLIIEYSRNVLLLNQLYCSMLETNKLSLSLFKKNGFIQYGFRKAWIKTNKNNWEGEILLQLLL